MDWKAIVKNVAPVLGHSLGGPMGGTAVKFLAGKLLGKDNATESELADYIETADPSQLLELKKLDTDYKLQMKKLGVDVLRLESEDRASARAMASTNMTPHNVLAGIYTCAYAALIFALVTGNVNVDPDLDALTMAVIGSLTPAQTSILNFYFGSSSGSRAKDEARTT